MVKNEEEHHGRCHYWKIRESFLRRAQRGRSVSERSEGSQECGGQRGSPEAVSAGHTRIAQRLVSRALEASKRNKDSGERIRLC